MTVLSFPTSEAGGTSAFPGFVNDKVPAFLRTVVAQERPTTRRQAAEQAVLTLNTSMMTIYDEALARYKQNLRNHAPIILALFSGEGGQFTLYRPGHEPLVADRVPVTYQIAKSIGHSSMAIYQTVAPFLSEPTSPAWRATLDSYRTQNRTALASLPELELTAEDRDILENILKRNLAFMDECLEKGTFTYQGLETFAREVAKFSVKTIGIAASAQVRHWMGVVESWKELLGDDWQRTYAVSNSLYVTRQNNILYTVLAQFMGQEAMGDRLLLIETPQFTTTPDEMLTLLTRIIADRGIGMVFFRDYFLMDVELLGGGARKVIEEESIRRGIKPLLPTLAPFFSNDWPWKTNPSIGKGPARLEDVK